MTTPQNDNEEPQGTTLGELLRRAREIQKKTLAGAAEVTRIKTVFLHALEQDDFEKLPDEIFTRGFIKIYATYLGLDPDDTIKHYISQEELNLNQSKTKVKVIYRNDIINSELLDRTSIFVKKKSRKIMPITILLTILVLFYILGVYFNDEEQTPVLLSEPEIISSPVEQSPQTDAAIPGKQEDQIIPKIAEPASQPAQPTTPAPPVKSPPQVKQKIKPEPIALDPPPVPAKGKRVQPAPKAALVQPIEPVKPIKQIETIKPTAPVSQPIITASKPTPAVTLPITVKVATTSKPILVPNTTDIDFKYVLEARFNESSRLRIKVDDKPQLQYTSQAGIVRVWQANERIVLNLDNRAGVSLTLNGQPFSYTNTDGPTATINIPADIPDNNQP